MEAWKEKMDVGVQGTEIAAVMTFSGRVACGAWSV